MLTEGAMSAHENRQRSIQLMFECFNVPLAYTAMQPVLALYATGRTTGTHTHAHTHTEYVYTKKRVFINLCTNVCVCRCGL